MNDLSNLKVFNRAVASQKGQIDLYISRYNTGGHSIFPTDSSERIKVQAISIEDIFRENNLKAVDYLKIDAEGSEFDIILNSPETLFDNINKIVLEYHDFFPTKQKHKELQNYLKKLGYEVSSSRLIWDKLLKTGMIFARKKQA